MLEEVLELKCHIKPKFTLMSHDHHQEEDIPLFEAQRQP